MSANDPAVSVDVESLAARLRSAKLARALHRLGWEARDVDVDLVRCTLRIELHRYDGRWVTLWTDALARTMLERWSRTPRIVRAFGNGPEIDSHEDTFLGRVRFRSPEAGLDALLAYVFDNPLRTPMLDTVGPGLNLTKGS